MRSPFLPAAATVSVALLLAACGGGSDPSNEPPAVEQAAAPDATALALTPHKRQGGKKAGATGGKTSGTTSGGTPNASGPTDSQRIAAAAATATSSTNACAPLAPFYWEVGSAGGALASGSVDSPASTTHYTATTLMPVASASKWLYGAYVVEKRGGNPTADDRKYLSMRAGYVSMRNCTPGQTVDGCLNTGTNGAYNASTEGRFYYNGGHMQKHASLLGLGAMDSKALVTEMKSRLGSDVALQMQAPMVAGSFVLSPASYANFLRKMMNGTLRIGGLLASDPVCTSPRQCGMDQAIYEPMPTDEVDHYTLGHWIEDDPTTGDGAFSSAGALGFYPWISADKSTYGMLARVDQTGDSPAWSSMACGRLIRKAWFSGVAQ